MFEAIQSGIRTAECMAAICYKSQIARVDYDDMVSLGDRFIDEVSRGSAEEPCRQAQPLQNHPCKNKPAIYYALYHCRSDQTRALFAEF